MRSNGILAVIVAAGIGTATTAYGKVTPGVARAPLMGWNTWCTQNDCTVDWCTSAEVLDVAQTMKDLGMQAYGWDYIALDDCWGVRNNHTLQIEGDPDRFPEGMPAFISKIHALGFKFGLYTDWGAEACHHPFTGSWPYYAEDTQTFAEWKVDMVKLDGCNVPPGHNPEQLAHNFSDALAATEAPIWMYFHCWHTETCGEYGNSFRVYSDHHDNWESTSSVIDFLRTSRQPFWGAGPKQGFPDPDFLFTGGEGCGQHSAPGQRCPGQSNDEYISEFSIFAIGGGQLIFATDPRNMTDFMKGVLLNKEVIDVFQDTTYFDNITVVPYQPSSKDAHPAASPASCSVTLEKQASHAECTQDKSFGCFDGEAKMWTQDGCRGTFTCDGVQGVQCNEDGSGRHECPCVPQPTQAWVRPMSGDSKDCAAVALYNPGSAVGTSGIALSKIPVVGWGPSTKVNVRDLWAHEQLPVATGSFTHSGIPPHGTVMVKMCKAVA